MAWMTHFNLYRKIFILKLAWKYGSVTWLNSWWFQKQTKILSQTQLYSITSFYQISKALIQRSKNPPPPFFPNHAKFFSLIPKTKITLLDRPVTWSIQFWIYQIICFAFCIFAERDIQARDLRTRADRTRAENGRT